MARRSLTLRVLWFSKDYFTPRERPPDYGEVVGTRFTQHIEHHRRAGHHALQRLDQQRHQVLRVGASRGLQRVQRLGHARAVARVEVAREPVRRVVRHADHLVLGVEGTYMAHRTEDLFAHNCLNFSFRRAEPVWPFLRDGRDFNLSVRGSIEANNGETLGQLATAGVGIARVGAFSAAFGGGLFTNHRSRFHAAFCARP